MPKARLSFFSCIVLVTIACADPDTAPRVIFHRGILTSRAEPIPTIPLVVTISNADELGNGYGIRSDGNGDYIDGLQTVQAVLDASGTFAFNTQSSGKKSITRYVSYNFNNPVDPANTYRPSPSNSVNYHFSTGPSQLTPFVPIQNLGVNGNPISECVYMGNSFGNGTTAWRVSYHKGLEDVSTSPTAYAVVTRTSISPAIWTVSPRGSCSSSSNVAALRSDDSSVLYGYYNIPFLFTLRAK